MRGLSGAVTALILVVASVVIALIVVGFAFNLFGSFGSAGAVSPVGPAYIYTSSAPSGIQYQQGYVYLVVTMDNRGPNVNITSATINGQTISNSNSNIEVYNANSNPPKQISGVYIPAGQNQLVIQFKVANTNVGSGPVNIQLVLANGQTIYVTASVAG